jgi:uncharacterized protein DUF5063
MAGDFEQLARRFCDFCERETSEGREAFVAELERHLVTLYGAALELIPADPPEEDAPPVAHEEWRAVYDRVAARLGAPGAYWLVYDPFVEEAPVLSQLADDVADIYRDIRAGLALLDRRPAEAPSWEWRSTFDSHWGRHAASAIYALHMSP